MNQQLEYGNLHFNNCVFCTGTCIVTPDIPVLEPAENVELTQHRKLNINVWNCSNVRIIVTLCQAFSRHGPRGCKFLAINSCVNFRY